MALALVGGSFLSAFLQVLFDRMASPEFLNLFRKRKADDELLKKLKNNLLAVGAVLDDAENKEISNQAVKEWLVELHEIVYQADDLLDEINTEVLRVQVESEYQSSTNILASASTYFSSFSNQFFKRIMPDTHSIQHLKARLGPAKILMMLKSKVRHLSRQHHAIEKVHQ